MLKELFEKYYDIAIKELKDFKSGYNSQVESLYKPIEYALEGGKKIRLLSVMLGADIFDGNLNDASIVAAAVEIFHNFTLLHDDVMDNSSVRRNRPTVQAKWNANQAILSGDAMLILVYQKLLKLNNDKIFSITELLNKTALEVCEGQLLDMEFETRTNITMDKYLQMIKLKTAVLLATALATGAMVSATSQNNIDNIYNFGLNLGMAFQVQDDYFDTFGDFDTFGKKIGNDIVTNKKTFLIIKALELADEKTRKRLTELYTTPQNDEVVKIQKVTKFFKSLNIDKIAMETAEKYYSESLGFLEKIEEIPTEKRQVLLEFAEYILKRKK